MMSIYAKLKQKDGFRKKGNSLNVTKEIIIILRIWFVISLYGKLIFFDYNLDRLRLYYALGAMKMLYETLNVYKFFNKIFLNKLFADGNVFKNLLS